jgi:outer membrane biosynthesis protein TonB
MIGSMRESDKGMRAQAGARMARAAVGIAALALSACSVPPALRPVTAPVAQATGQRPVQSRPPEPVSPFSDTPTSLMVHGRFVPGEHVLVEVCLHPDRSIASSTILLSSGDARFDTLALAWARRVRLRESAADRPVAACWPVDVELRDNSPFPFASASDQLG